MNDKTFLLFLGPGTKGQQDWQGGGHRCKKESFYLIKYVIYSFNLSSFKYIIIKLSFLMYLVHIYCRLVIVGKFIYRCNGEMYLIYYLS